jgi:hypothetical protein
LLAATVYWFFEFRRKDREFYEWIDARPMSATVDLSKLGRFTTAFRQSCQTAHGEAIYVSMSATDVRGQDVDQPLEGLEGTIAITDAEGNEVVVGEIASQNDKLRYGVPTDNADRIMVCYFQPFATGDYTARVNITRGATKLAATHQTMFAQYELCGLERFPALIAAGFAILCALPGLIISLFVAIGFRRHGIYVSPRRQSRSIELARATLP